jgi:hypothetical protein
MYSQTTTSRTKHSLGRRLQRLALGGALAALLAVGAAGAGVQGDPSQWGAAKNGPSTSRDPQASRPSGGNDPMTAINFTKIEYQALNYTKITYTAINFTKIEL